MERGYASQVTLRSLFLTCQMLMNVVFIHCQYAHFEHSWTKFRNVNKTIMPKSPLSKSRTCWIQTRTLPKLHLLFLPLYTRWKKPSPVFYTSAELQIADSRLISSRCAGGSLAGYPSARMHIGTQQRPSEHETSFPRLFILMKIRVRINTFHGGWWVGARCRRDQRLYHLFWGISTSKESGE